VHAVIQQLDPAEQDPRIDQPGVDQGFGERTILGSTRDQLRDNAVVRLQT